MLQVRGPTTRGDAKRRGNRNIEQCQILAYTRHRRIAHSTVGMPHTRKTTTVDAATTREIFVKLLLDQYRVWYDAEASCLAKMCDAMPFFCRPSVRGHLHHASPTLDIGRPNFIRSDRRPQYQYTFDTGRTHRQRPFGSVENRLQLHTGQKAIRLPPVRPVRHCVACASLHDIVKEKRTDNPVVHAVRTTLHFPEVCGIR